MLAFEVSLWKHALSENLKGAEPKQFYLKKKKRRKKSSQQHLSFHQIWFNKMWAFFSPLHLACLLCNHALAHFYILREQPQFHPLSRFAFFLFPTGPFPLLPLRWEIAIRHTSAIANVKVIFPASRRASWAWKARTGQSCICRLYGMSHRGKIRSRVQCSSQQAAVRGDGGWRSASQTRLKIQRATPVNPATSNPFRQMHQAFARVKQPGAHVRLAKDLRGREQRRA